MTEQPTCDERKLAAPFEYDEHDRDCDCEDCDGDRADEAREREETDEVHHD